MKLLAWLIVSQYLPFFFIVLLTALIAVWPDYSETLGVSKKATLNIHECLISFTVPKVLGPRIFMNIKCCFGCTTSPGPKYTFKLKNFELMCINTHDHIHIGTLGLFNTIRLWPI